MKKSIIIPLAAVLCLNLLAGCNAKDSSTPPNSKQARIRHVHGVGDDLVRQRHATRQHRTRPQGIGHRYVSGFLHASIVSDREIARTRARL